LNAGSSAAMSGPERARFQAATRQVTLALQRLEVVRDRRYYGTDPERRADFAHGSGVAVFNDVLPDVIENVLLRTVRLSIRVSFAGRFRPCR